MVVFMRMTFLLSLLLFQTESLKIGRGKLAFVYVYSILINIYYMASTEVTTGDLAMDKIHMVLVSPTNLEYSDSRESHRQKTEKLKK